MASRLAYLLCLLFAACALAAKPLDHQTCVASCYYTLLKVKYQGKTDDDQTACTNPYRVNSTYLCTRMHCEDSDIVPGIAWWSKTCKKSSKVVSVDLYHDVADAATPEYLASLPTVGSKEKSLVQGLAVPTEEAFEPIRRSLYTYVDQRNFNLKIRWSIYGFWGLVVLFGAVERVMSFFPTRKSVQSMTGPSTGAYSKLKNWTNASIFMSPSFGYHHHVPLGWFHVPLRIQSLIVAAYFIMNIILMVPYYNIFDNNYYYASRREQFLRYFCDRLAHLLTAALPFVFIFGGRANVLVYVTGWSYRTFNIFHRWIAIIFTIEGIIHGCTFSAYEVVGKGWPGLQDHLKTDEIFQYGIMMLICLGLILVFSLNPVRQRVYEIFKFSHIALTAVFIASLHLHIRTQFSGAYEVWAWVCIGLWAGDYFLRGLRLLFLNYKSLVGRGIPALASYSQETGMIRLQVHPSAFPSRRQTPGTYYFLHFPSWRVWENHPFTLAGRSAEADDASLWTGWSPEQSDREMEMKKPPVSPRLRVLGTAKSKEEYLTFMIKPREGMTMRLRDSLRREDLSWGHRRLNVILEGPYGAAAQLDHFENVLFLAGGSGITSVLPYLRMFFEDAPARAKRGETRTHIPNTKLAWTVRNEGFARDVLANDLRHTEASRFAPSKLDMEFFVTAEPDDRYAGGGDGEKRHLGDSRFKRERPNVEKLIEDFVAGNPGRTAIFVCGPAAMADQTRASVVRLVKRGYSHVELFEEMFSM